jgi:hypothetical protein
MDLSGAEAETWLARAVQMGAARVLQTVLEYLQGGEQMTGGVVNLLQISLNMLRDPARAAHGLLSIPAPGAGP